MSIETPPSDNKPMSRWEMALIAALVLIALVSGITTFQQHDWIVYGWNPTQTTTAGE